MIEFDVRGVMYPIFCCFIRIKSSLGISSSNGHKSPPPLLLCFNARISTEICLENASPAGKKQNISL